MSDDDDSDAEIDQRSEITPSNTWISWFCNLDGHEYMVEVDPEYISNPHNLIGLKK